MSNQLTPSQQELADKIAAIAKENPEFRFKLAENEGAALAEVGLLDDYQKAFTDVSGYRDIAGDGSTCCVSDISGTCCLSCWFSLA
jgi:hypothetical protein